MGFNLAYLKKRLHGTTATRFFFIQRRGRVVTDFKNRQKVCLLHYNCPLVKLAPKSTGQVISTRFISQEKFVQ